MGPALLLVLQQQPFRPLRIFLSAGIKHEVKHPELAMVGVLTLLLQTPSDNPLISLAHREFVIALDHIIQVETLYTPDPTLN